MLTDRVADTKGVSDRVSDTFATVSEDECGSKVSLCLVSPDIAMDVPWMPIEGTLS